MPSHYLNQCCTIVRWIPRNKFQWNFNRNLYIFTHENPFQYVVLKMAAILSRPQCVIEYCTVVLFDIAYPLSDYNDLIMSMMTSQITSLAMVDSTVHSGADQRKHQSSASLAFARGIHRWPVNSPHKGPVTRKIFPFDDVIMFRGVARRRPRGPGLNLKMLEKKSQNPDPFYTKFHIAMLNIVTLNH